MTKYLIIGLVVIAVLIYFIKTSSTPVINVSGGAGGSTGSSSPGSNPFLDLLSGKSGGSTTDANGLSSPTVLDNLVNGVKSLFGGDTSTASGPAPKVVQNGLPTNVLTDTTSQTSGLPVSDKTGFSSPISTTQISNSPPVTTLPVVSKPMVLASMIPFKQQSAFGNIGSGTTMARKTIQ